MSGMSAGVPVALMWWSLFLAVHGRFSLKRRTTGSKRGPQQRGRRDLVNSGSPQRRRRRLQVWYERNQNLQFVGRGNQHHDRRGKSRQVLLEPQILVHGLAGGCAGGGGATRREAGASSRRISEQTRLGSLEHSYRRLSAHGREIFQELIQRGGSLEVME